MKLKYVFEDGKELDLTDFKGCWVREDIIAHFGKEIEELIWQETIKKVMSRKTVIDQNEVEE